MKIGIFGGSFNPPHNGHVNSIQTVLKKAGMDKIYVVPAFQNPLKKTVEGPTPEQRLEMTNLVVSELGPQFVVDDQEIVRGGKSYTIDTIRNIKKNHPKDELFLIIGVDKWSELPEWKSATDLFKEVNIIVTTRPGFDLPTNLDEFPGIIRDLVVEHDFNFVELKTGKSIQFLKLKDIGVSGTELRKSLRAGRNVEKVLPLSIESYVREHKLYKRLTDKVSDYEKFTHFCAQQLHDRKGINIRAFDLRKLSAVTEFTLIASGTSTRHTVSMAENLATAVKEEFGIHPLSYEGTDEGRWVVLDYGSLMVHLFYDFVRQEYALERLWKDGSEIQLNSK